MGGSDPAPEKPGESSIFEGVKVCEDGRVRYPDSYQTYGEMYDRAARSIRELVKIGKAADDLPPLHVPQEMPAWWERHMKHAVPESIVRASRTQDGEVVERLELEECATVTMSEESMESVDVSLVDAGGANDGYQRAARLEAAAYQRLEAEMKKSPVNKAEVDYWASRHQKLQLSRRQWEKDISDIRKKAGELIDRASLVGELVSLAGGIARNQLRSYKAIIDELAPDSMSIEDREAMAILYRDKAFAELRESEFSDAFQNHDS